MELYKTLYNNNVSTQNALKKDLKTLSTMLSDSFDICWKGSSQQVSVADLAQYMQSKMQMTNRCSALTKTGTRCTRSAIEGVYCKTHVHLVCPTKLGITHEEQESILIYEGQTTETTETEDLHKVFIDGTFYLSDEKYVYDKSTRERVGYKDGDTYVLSLDPFVLGLCQT